MKRRRIVQSVFRLLLSAIGWAALLIGCLFAVLMLAEFSVSLQGLAFAVLCAALGAILAISLLTLAQRIGAKQESVPPPAETPSAPDQPQKETSPTLTAPSPTVLDKVAEVLADLLTSDKPLPLSVGAPAPRAEQQSLFLIRRDGDRLRLIVGVHERGSDMLMQHHLFAGTKDELLAYLASDTSRAAFTESLLELSDLLFFHD